MTREILGRGAETEFEELFCANVDDAQASSAIVAKEA